MSRIISILVLILVLSACKRVLFDQPMPIGAASVKNLPVQFNGSFISVHVDSHSVMGQVHRIVRKSDTEVRVYFKDLKFIDSLYLVNNNLSYIDTAWYQDDSIQVRANNSSFSLPLDKAEIIKEEDLEFWIDLKLQLYMSIMEDSAHCQLNKVNDQYFLNVEEEPNLYNTTLIMFDGDNVLFKHLTISNDIGQTHIHTLSERYNLKEEKEEKGKFFTTQYLASLNNQQFRALLNEEGVFATNYWYKLKPPPNYRYWMVAILALILTTLFLLQRMRKR